MNKRQFEQILKSGEGARVEFKKAVSSSLGREMVAFANTAGGQVFIGVDDKNAVIGCKLTNEMKSRVQDIANNCDPRVPIKIKSFKYNDKDEKEFGQKAISVARNPVIFDIFHRLQLIEKVGTGVQRIITAIQARKLSIEFYFGRFFSVTFFRPVLIGHQKNIPGLAPDKIAKIPLEKAEEDIADEAPRKYPASTPQVPVPRMI